MYGILRAHIKIRQVSCSARRRSSAQRRIARSNRIAANAIELLSGSHRGRYTYPPELIRNIARTCKKRSLWHVMHGDIIAERKPTVAALPIYDRDIC